MKDSIEENGTVEKLGEINNPLVEIPVDEIAKYRELINSARISSVVKEELTSMLIEGNTNFLNAFEAYTSI
ncbi:MAG: hypothetical protein ABI721_04975 [Candidatus Dojkabacteria bacterium]